MKYQPITCALHDEYEIAIMHRKPLMIRWLDERGGQRQETVLANDIQVKNKEEFLIAKTVDGTDLRIRLDKVTLL